MSAAPTTRQLRSPVVVGVNPRQSEPISEMRPLTGEPDAGNPPVRFGGRGEVQSLVPTPIPCSAAASAEIVDGVLECARQSAASTPLWSCPKRHTHSLRIRIPISSTASREEPRNPQRRNLRTLNEWLCASPETALYATDVGPGRVQILFPNMPIKATVRRILSCTQFVLA